MAQKPLSIFSFFLVFNILLMSSSFLVLAGRDIPKKNVDDSNSKNADVKHPEWFFDHDRSFLIPGLGRVIVPRVGDHVNPITYNPITGGNGGYHGYITPIYGGTPSPVVGGGTGDIPGGDDTFLPSPGGDATPTSPVVGGGSGTGDIPGGDDTFLPSPPGVPNGNP